MICKNPRKNLEETINPTLYDRSYEPDPSSHESRWTNRVFRDSKTGALTIPTPEYLIGWNINGTFNPTSGIIENKRERPNAEYAKTRNHEHYHARGHGEYTTRFLNGDPWMNYN